MSRSLADISLDRHYQRRCTFSSRGPFLHKEHEVLAICRKFTHLLVHFLQSRWCGSVPKLTNIRYVEVFVSQALQTCSRQQFVRDRLQIAEITRLPPRRRLEGCGSKVIMRWGANYANYALLAPCKTIEDFCYQIGS